MALVILAVQRWLTPSNTGAYTHLVAVGLPILAAVAVYAGLIVALRVEEASVAWRVVRLRLVGGR
jgi:hypothetical protein